MAASGNDFQKRDLFEEANDQRRKTGLATLEKIDTATNERLFSVCSYVMNMVGGAVKDYIDNMQKFLFSLAEKLYALEAKTNALESKSVAKGGDSSNAELMRLLSAKTVPIYDDTGKLIGAQRESADDTLAKLEKRIAVLEARPGMDYRGIFSPEEDYREGDMVTHSGSMFFCHKSTRGNRPGQSDAWQLAVKRGRDAR